MNVEDETLFKKQWDEKWDFATKQIAILRRVSGSSIATALISQLLQAVLAHYGFTRSQSWLGCSFWVFTALGLAATMVWGVFNRHRDRLLDELTARTQKMVDENEDMKHWLGECQPKEPEDDAMN